MDIDLADIVLHIDQTLDQRERERIEALYRQRDGVVSAHFNPDRPHLLLVDYNPCHISGQELLDILRFNGLKSEMIGL